MVDRILPAFDFHTQMLSSGCPLSPFDTDKKTCLAILECKKVPSAFQLVTFQKRLRYVTNVATQSQWSAAARAVGSSMRTEVPKLVHLEKFHICPVWASPRSRLY